MATMLSILPSITAPPSLSSSRLQASPTPKISSHVFSHPSAVLLELCTNSKELDQFLPPVIKHGLFYEHIFQTKLISLFSKFGRLHEAALVFDSVLIKNDELYHCMLKGHARNSSLDDALSFFVTMRCAQVEPVVYNFTYLLKACGDRSDLRRGEEVHSLLISYGFASNIFAMTAILNMYAKCRRMDEARKVFDRMPARDLVAWNAIVSGYAQNGFAELAMKSVSQMQEDWRKPDTVTLVSVLPSFYSGSTNHPQSKKIYARLDLLLHEIKAVGYVPHTSSIHDVEDDVKEQLLNTHSEKLAIAFGLINTSPGATICIRKNLRFCIDCHNAAKLISQVTARQIVVRDIHRFHHFKDGLCSCGDYW